MEDLSDRDRRILRGLQSGKSVRQVIEDLSNKYLLSVDEATSKIYSFWKRGYIDLSNPRKPGSLIDYLLSVEAIQLYGITILIVLTIFLVLYVHSPPFIYIRYILGSLFVLYLPGYALIEALYPRGDELEPLERIALSIGLSLALVPLIGLILNYTPWGIRLNPIIAALSITTEALISIATIKKFRYAQIS